MDQEIQELKSLWELVDQNNLDEVKQWLIDYEYIGITTQAMIMGRGIDYTRRLKKKVGLGGKMPENLPPPYKKRIPSKIKVPEQWSKDAKWLARAYKKYPVTYIAKAIGVSKRRVYNRLVKFGIKSIPRKSYNKHCNSQWVHEHYVKQQLSQEECARIAGIAVQTFARWLIKFNIPSRTASEAQKNNSAKLWVRKLKKDLEAQPIVRLVIAKHNEINVRYKNYYWESYSPDTQFDNKRFFMITKETARIEKIPRIIRQFESDIGEDQYPAHLVIPKKEWLEAKIIERRLAMHEFAKQIMLRGWIWPFYPQYVIDRELEKLKNTNLSKFIINNEYLVKQNRRVLHGMRILEHYFGMSEFYNILARPRLVVMALNVLTKRNTVYDTHNIIRATMSISRYKVVNPQFYWALFRSFGIKGRILDLRPNCGSRALAAAMCGIKYVTKPNRLMEYSKSLGFCDFVDLDYEVDDELGKFDLVILENDLRTVELDEALQYANRAKCIMAFVNKTYRVQLQKQYKPRHVLKIRRDGDHISYLFVW